MRSEREENKKEGIEKGQERKEKNNNKKISGINILSALSLIVILVVSMSLSAFISLMSGKNLQDEMERRFGELFRDDPIIIGSGKFWEIVECISNIKEFLRPLAYSSALDTENNLQPEEAVSENKSGLLLNDIGELHLIMFDMLDELGEEETEKYLRNVFRAFEIERKFPEIGGFIPLVFANPYNFFLFRHAIVLPYKSDEGGEERKGEGEGGVVGGEEEKEHFMFLSFIDIYSLYFMGDNSAKMKVGRLGYLAEVKKEIQRRCDTRQESSEGGGVKLWFFPDSSVPAEIIFVISFLLVVSAFVSADIFFGFGTGGILAFLTFLLTLFSSPNEELKDIFVSGVPILGLLHYKFSPVQTIPFTMSLIISAILLIKLKNALSVKLKDKLKLGRVKPPKKIFIPASKSRSGKGGFIKRETPRINLPLNLNFPIKYVALHYIMSILGRWDNMEKSRRLLFLVSVFIMSLSGVFGFLLTKDGIFRFPNPPIPIGIYVIDEEKSRELFPDVFHSVDKILLELTEEGKEKSSPEEEKGEEITGEMEEKGEGIEAAAEGENQTEDDFLSGIYEMGEEAEENEMEDEGDGESSDKSGVQGKKGSSDRENVKKEEEKIFSVSQDFIVFSPTLFDLIIYLIKQNNMIRKKSSNQITSTQKIEVENKAEADNHKTSSNPDNNNKDKWDEYIELVNTICTLMLYEFCNDEMLYESIRPQNLSKGKAVIFPPITVVLLGKNEGGSKDKSKKRKTLKENAIVFGEIGF